MPEILQHFGYLSVPGLRGMVRAWGDTLDALKPDLILCDYAPTALLATRGKPLVRTAIGSGFSIPPLGCTPMPVFRSISPEVRVRSVEAEKRVTQVVQRVAIEVGQPAINNICDIFAADEQFLCTIPELDHYQRTQPARYWNLPTQASTGRRPAWSDCGRPRVFAYLKPPGAYFDATIRALQQSGCEAEIFAPGISLEMSRQLDSEYVRISPQPYDLVKTFESCDVVICHAGHDTVVAALLAGRPVLLIPLQMEQYALAQLVEAWGIGELVAPDALEKLPEALHRTLSKPCIGRARVFGRKYAANTPEVAACKIVERCEELLMF